MKRLLLLAAFAAAVSSLPAQEWANQPWAKARLDKSPRHLEWVTVKNGDRAVKAYVAFPEVKSKATAVVLIHENRGLTDWVRSMADQMAEAGYVAIAPDLLSGAGPNGGGTAEITSNDDAGKAITAVSQKPEQITGDLNAIVAYVAGLPASNGKVVVGGFCWGGGQTFRFATNNKDIKAALVFYGPSPAEGDLAKITAPVHGFYAENDARINAALPKTEEAMKAAGKKFDPVTYAGAGHGFMRAGDAPPPAGDADEKAKSSYAANKKARDDAWVRIKAILAKI